MDRLMSVQEVADHLGVPVGTIYRWRLVGTGPRGARIGRFVKFRRSDVDAWVEQQLDQQPGETARTTARSP